MGRPKIENVNMKDNEINTITFKAGANDLSNAVGSPFYSSASVGIAPFQNIADKVWENIDSRIGETFKIKVGQNIIGTGRLKGKDRSAGRSLNFDGVGRKLMNIVEENGGTVNPSEREGTEEGDTDIDDVDDALASADITEIRWVFDEIVTTNPKDGDNENENNQENKDPIDNIVGDVSSDESPGLPIKRKFLIAGAIIVIYVVVSR